MHTCAAMCMWDDARVYIYECVLWKADKKKAEKKTEETKALVEPPLEWKQAYKGRSLQWKSEPTLTPSTQFKFRVRSLMGREEEAGEWSDVVTVSTPGVLAWSSAGVRVCVQCVCSVCVAHAWYLVCGM
jgi:hypothetical protein